MPILKNIAYYIFITMSAVCAASVGEGQIPFPEALQAAEVELSSIRNERSAVEDEKCPFTRVQLVRGDGQAESLMVGNGDLYGIVWENEGSLIMRITKNDIWDARIDTSEDGPLPKVDIAVGTMTGSYGAPPSFSKKYPQPRAATALRLGPTALARDPDWSCIRTGPAHALTPDVDGAGAVMEVSGAGQSTGYETIVPGAPQASSLEIILSGSQHASYYLDIFDNTGKNIYKSGWRQSPDAKEKITAVFTPAAVGKISLYTQSSDSGIARNQFRDLTLQTTEGELVLDFGRASKSVVKSHLDLRRALASISSEEGGETQIRVLHDRNVLLVKSPHPITLDPIKAGTLPDATLGTVDGMDWLLMDMPGDIDYAGMNYAVAVASRGAWKAVALVTSFDIGSREVLPRALALAKETLDADVASLIATHEAGWERDWSRSGVALQDPAMQRWWYRMLYFAQAICKPGTSPAGVLPPLATDRTPWHGDFHHNYNSWQAYYPLPGANHAELTDPWIAYINEQLPKFRYLAQAKYGIEGAVMDISSFLHEPDPALSQSVNKRQIVKNPWGMTIGLGAMTLQSMWHRHLLEPDVAYMEAKIYPTLRELAKFYVGFMEQCKVDDDGKVLLGPSYSPEHGSFGIYNCPYDIAYIHYTFDALMQAAEELDCDAELAAQCRHFKALLPDYPTTMHAGKEIVVDWLGGDYFRDHNITVPAVPVFPGDQVTWFSPEPVKQLFRDTIEVTHHNDNNAHVMFNIAKARLSMPDGYTNAREWFISRELPNGFFRWAGHVHGTFMPEMNGIFALINEFLMQSVDNKIRIFPCWPADKDAAFTRLRAQGGFLVSAEKKNGAVVHLEIFSTVGGTLQVLSPWERVQVNGNTLRPDAQGLVTVQTSPGERFIFKKL